MPGCERLFEEMADVHGAALRRWARTHAARIDAADLIQDAFERALRKRPPVRDHDELRAWLFVVARNLMIDRTRAAESRIVFGVELDGLAAAVPEEPPPWRSVEWSDVRDALPRLDPRLRAVFTMFSQGMSLLQISAAVNAPVATVGTRLFRARKRLRSLVLERAHAADAAPTPARVQASITIPASTIPASTIPASRRTPASRPNRGGEALDLPRVQHFAAANARPTSHQHAVV